VGGHKAATKLLWPFFFNFFPVLAFFQRFILDCSPGHNMLIVTLPSESDVGLRAAHKHRALYSYIHPFKVQNIFVDVFCFQRG
jgi:hypothetical protein